MPVRALESGLVGRERAIECGLGETRFVDPLDGRPFRKVGTDDRTERIVDLRYQEQVGQRRRIAVTETAGAGIADQHRFERAEAHFDPIELPALERWPLGAELLGELPLRAQILERLEF